MFAGEVKKMQAEKMKPQEQVTVDLTLGGRVLNWIANLLMRRHFSSQMFDHTQK